MNRRTEQQILDQLEAVRAAGGQVHSTSELGDAPVASDVYADRVRYEEEIRKIFFRSWIPVARVSELDQPGNWLHRSIERAELVVTRDEEGELHAFHNTCLHRGSALVSADGCGRRLVCPYHAWSYELSGRLANVPERRAYPLDFEPGERKLGQVLVGVMWGFIWVNLARDADPLETFLGPELLDEFTNFGLDRLEHRGRVEREGDFDWKASVENYLEPYHAPRVHPRSIHPLIQHKGVTMEWWSDHSRMVIPLRAPKLYETQQRVGDAAFAPILPGLNSVQRTTTLVYLVWPSLIVNFLPNHVLTVHIRPVAPGRTRVVLDVFAGSGTSEAEVTYFQKLNAGYEDFVTEDFAVCTAVQQGLAGPFHPPLTLSHYDRRIRHFRNRVEVWLGHD